jgi:hypothetical protein
MIVVVVARYTENMEWTKQFNNVIIYNKGSQLECDYNQVLLNNVGKEGHTYYKYICDNYENLEEYTVFLQGNPFDHSPNIISNLNKYINDKEVLNDFEFLSEDIHYSSFSFEATSCLLCSNIQTTYERVFGERCSNDECIFGAGAQFIVSKHKILKKPKSFYENIVKILEYSINPTEGYDIERLHKYIFS